MEKYKNPASPQKVRNWVAFSLIGAAILVASITLVLVFCLGNNSSLASNPDEVYETAKVGMASEDFFKLIDRNYASEACYIVNCDLIEPNVGMWCSPTLDLTTDYFLYVFMPRQSETQATIVGFYNPLYDPSSGDLVVLVKLEDYDIAQILIELYGSRTFW